MDKETTLSLSDILNAINEIDTFFTGRPKDFHSYENDLRTKRAVERNIEIIGEAIVRINSAGDNVNLSHSKEIVDISNHMIHDHNPVSDQVVWKIVTEYLPVLKTEVKTFVPDESGIAS